jgi:hypothetical protein
MFPLLSKSLWLVLFMIGTPLILKVMQLFYVLKHHVTRTNFELSNIQGLSEHETCAERDRGFDSHRFIETIFEVVVLSVV